MIFPSLETVHLTKDGHISFWGLPVDELRHVVPRLMETANTDQALGGVMIHCYRSLAEALDSPNPGAPVKEESSPLQHTYRSGPPVADLLY